MQIHGLQQSQAVQPNQHIGAGKSSGTVEAAPGANAVASDQLDLSFEAQQISEVQASAQGQAINGIRTEKVAELRQAIADGTYETPEKLDAALDRLLDTFA